VNKDLYIEQTHFSQPAAVGVNDVNFQQTLQRGAFWQA